MGLASKIQDKIKYGLGGRLFRPSVKVEPSRKLVRLGSGYGGWTIEESSSLKRCLAISCGLGEDASFDVEFAALYDADVIIIDPTPRSVVHYQRLAARIGKGAEARYAGGGCQPAEAYDLAHVRASQLRFEEKALWINEDPIRFYKPTNPDHVSHSIKFKPKATGEDQFIVVPTVTIASLLADVPAERFALLKMDIEGAEVEILDSIADWPTLPQQILVEFDVLRKPGNASKSEVERVDALLRRHGYACRHFDGDRNYLYSR